MEEENRNEKGLLIEGAKGYFWDAVGFCAAGLLVFLALLALAAVVSCFVSLGMFYTGVEIPEAYSLGGWLVPLAHVVVICVGLVLVNPRRLPEALKKRGEAVRRERVAEAARERIAARGGYVDPRRNKGESLGEGAR